MLFETINVQLRTPTQRAVTTGTDFAELQVLFAYEPQIPVGVPYDANVTLLSTKPSGALISTMAPSRAKAQTNGQTDGDVGEDVGVLVGTIDGVVVGESDG